ncbi:MAG: ATP-binding protein [Chloroflexota bacterium]
MSLLRDSLQLISTQSGALIYYLVTLFAIQLILGVAIGHWQRRRDEASTRLLAMGAGLFLARAILMLVAVFDRVGLASSDLVLPPLERFLHFTTVALVVWAFLPILQRIQDWSTGVLIATVLIAAGAYAAFATVWPGVEAAGTMYNGYWQERVWELSTTAILALAFVASLIWRGRQWGWLPCLLGVWLAGHGLQLATPVVDAHTPGWVRLATLAALPLLAGLVYRRALASTPVVAEERGESALGAVGVLRAVQRIGAGDSVESALELAASSVARAVDADVAAIGLSASGTNDVIRLVALHPRTDVMVADEEPILAVSEHPLLGTALQSQHLERAVGEREIQRVAPLYRRLGFEVAGPLLVQPVAVEEEVFGVILAGNPDSQREWSRREEQIVQAVAGALASAMGGERGSGAIADADLEASRAEAERIRERAARLEAELERQRQWTDELATQLRLREKEAEEETEASDELAFWQEEVRELTEARDALQAQLSHWREKAEKVTETKAELEARLKPMSSAGGKSRRGCFGGIVVGDERGRIVLASQGTHRLLGRTRGELMDASFEALFDEALWKKAVERLLGGREPTDDVTAIRLNVEGRMLQAELARLPENEIWPGRVAAAFYLLEPSTLQSGMVASLVHQLRTPMTSITGYTDLLLGEKVGILGESQRQFLERIEANIKRMEALLNDLTKVADVDRGQIELAPEPVDVADVVEDVLDSFSAWLEEKDLGVHAELAADLPPVHTDRDSLRQVVHNLISNAALASRPGTEIELSGRVEELPDEPGGPAGYVLVSVSDTGGGIAPEDQRHVFQRFYRAKNPLIEGLGETGVGLSVAKALVEANGGRIWVESEMGVGSTFSFVLSLTTTGDVQDFEAAPGDLEA